MAVDNDIGVGIEWYGLHPQLGVGVGVGVGVGHFV